MDTLQRKTVYTITTQTSSFAEFYYLYTKRRVHSAWLKWWVRAGPDRAQAKARPGPKSIGSESARSPARIRKNLNFWLWTNFLRSRDRQIAMKKFEYVDINTLYEWPELEVSPLITFLCKNNWKTYIKYIDGSSGFSGYSGYSGFLIGPARPDEENRGPGPCPGWPVLSLAVTPHAIICVAPSSTFCNLYTKIRKFGYCTEEQFLLSLYLAFILDLI